MNLPERILAVMEAGTVRRCHTLPHHGDYRVDGHSWGVCVLLRLLWPDRTDLLDYALFHDVPERWVGDTPSTALAFWPAMRDPRHLAEVEVFDRLELPSEHDMCIDDRRLLKAADRLELWLWAHHQVTAGNRHAEVFIEQLDQLFDREPLPDPAGELVGHVRERGLRHRQTEWLR